MVNLTYSGVFISSVRVVKSSINFSNPSSVPSSETVAIWSNVRPPYVFHCGSANIKSS